MDFIKLNKSNSVLEIGILDENDKDTGERLSFDLEDLELTERLAECERMHREAVKKFKAQMLVINKNEDIKEGGLLTRNEKQKIKALKEFYSEEEKALDLFLGEGGTKKMLNGRKPYITMYDDITSYLEPILPKIKSSIDNVSDKIKNKYNLKEIKSEGDILE